MHSSSEVHEPATETLPEPDDIVTDDDGDEVAETSIVGATDVGTEVDVVMVEPDKDVMDDGDKVTMEEGPISIVGEEVDGAMVVGGGGTRVHFPAVVPSLPVAMSQYASNPSHVFMHRAVIQVASLSPSHSSKGAMLEAA